MRKAIIVATLGSLVLAAPAAHANEWEGLAVALPAQSLPERSLRRSSHMSSTCRASCHHSSHVSRRTRRAPPRVIVIHDHAPVQASVPEGLVGDHGGLWKTEMRPAPAGCVATLRVA